MDDISIPAGITPTLASSIDSKLNDAQIQSVLKSFLLDRNAVLEQLKLTGRKPVIEGGGVSAQMAEV